MLYANGTGTLAPAKTASFGFGTSGQITELDVKIGDTVKAGQVIGKMDDTEVQAQPMNRQNVPSRISQHPLQLQQPNSQSQTQQSTYITPRQELEHLISSDVYYWEEQVATAQQTLASAQADGGSNPTADQKKKIDDATAALSRAQSNLQAAQLRYVNEYAPATFTYTVTDEDDR